MKNNLTCFIPFLLLNDFCCKVTAKRTVVKITFDDFLGFFRPHRRGTRHSLHFTKYFIKFYHTESGKMALVIHPHAIRYLVTGNPLPSNMFAYLDCEIRANGESDSPSAMSFSPQMTDGRWFALKQLLRCKDKALLSQMLDDERCEKIDDYAADAYDFTLSLAAITEDDIYIRRNEATFYKVPKSLDDLLCKVGFDSNVGVLTFKDTSNGQPSSYIAFDDFNLYYDVSTPGRRESCKIEVTDIIRP